MTKPTGSGYPVECVANQLLLVYTNEEIGSDDAYRTWWDGGFADIQSVPGLGEGTCHLVDPDQRTGQVPSWRYLVVHGFNGDSEQLKESIRAHAMAGDSALWLCEAMGDFVRKSDGLPGSRAGAAGGARKIGGDGTSGQGAQPEHLFLALTNALAGREAEFQKWYDQYHVPDVVAVGCYRSGRRFQIAATSGAVPPWKYLALYRFVGSVPQMHEEIQREMERGETIMTDALADDHGAWIFTQI